jgi:Ca2+-binding RTX toxin-like protein
VIPKSATVGSSGADHLFGSTGEDAISGLSGNDTLDGMDGNDHLFGGAGDDILDGGLGDDTYYYAKDDGNDVIQDGAEQGATDILTFEDLNLLDLTMSRSGEDLVITVNSRGETITLNAQYYDADLPYGIEKLIFADGTSLDLDHSPDTTWIYGTAGADAIDGTWGKDYIIGGLGDDVMNGGAGGDVYIYAKGDGNDTINDDVGFLDNLDVLRFTDLTLNDLSFWRVDEALFIGIKGTSDVITVSTQYYNAYEGWALERLDFADGTSMTLDHSPDTTWITGTAGADILDGTWGKDYFIGGLGDDVFNGSAGGDVYIYASGDGNDIINDGVGFADNVDVLRFTDLSEDDLTFVKDGGDFKITVAGTGQVITVQDQFHVDDPYWGVDRIEFADGKSWGLDQILEAVSIRGTAGNDNIVCTSSFDTIVGGAGDDQLQGNDGSDTFVFRTNFGHDTITDFVAGEGTDDVIDVSTDIFADFSAVMAAATQVGADALITHDASNSILLKNVALANLHQDDFRFTAAA